MRREFTLPDLGEGVAEGELVRWLVAEGDRVAEDQPVAELETDKALVELPSPVDGTVADLRAAEGDTVPVGSVLLVFEVADGTDADAGVRESGDEGDSESAEGDASVAATGSPESSEPSEPGESGDVPRRAFATPRVRRLARERGVDLAEIEGSGAGGRVTEADVMAAADGATSESSAGREPAAAESEAASPAVASAPTEDESGGVRPTSGAVEPADRERTLAAPATRRVAAELDVDVDDVPASETRDGRAFVTEADVRAYAEALAASAERETGSEAGAAAAGTAGAGGEAPPEDRVERVPYRGMRRTIGEQMVRSTSRIPHVTSTDEVDVTDLWETRSELKSHAAERGVDLTFTAFFVKAVAAALAEFPDLNAELDEERGEILQKRYYNVGVATATEAGLLVPVVRDADRKGLLEVAAELTEKTRRARDRSITREEMQDGTFTVTNIGTAGGQYATPVINYPEVAILGFGSIREKPWVVDGEVVPRRVLPLSLSFDHRVTDGATAAQFVSRVAELLHQPSLLLLE